MTKLYSKKKGQQRFSDFDPEEYARAKNRKITRNTLNSAVRRLNYLPRSEPMVRIPDNFLDYKARDF